jgi:hypothetical protein
VDPDPERTDTGLAREISLFSGANVGNVDFELTRFFYFLFLLYFIQQCSQYTGIEPKYFKMEWFITRLATKKCWEEQNSPKKQRTF